MPNIRLTVGVDARSLSRPVSGLGRYTLEMCLALNRLNSIHLYLYSPTLIPENVLSQFDRVTVRMADCRYSLTSHFWCETYLPWLLRSDDLDVFWGTAHRLPCLLPKTLARVVTIHDLVWKFAKNTMPVFSFFLEALLMPVAISRSDKIIAISKSTAQDLHLELGVSKSKISVIYPGYRDIREDKSNVKSKYLGPYILFVGTREPRKNLLGLLDAFSLLDSDVYGGVSLVIAGGGGWKLDIAKEMERLDIRDSVQVLGHVSDNTLGELYSGALFLAMPSLYEGFGLPLVEAMAHGLPVLTSNNSSMPEVAGEAALYVNPNDTLSIKAGLERLISDEKLRMHLVKAGDGVRDRFNWDDSAKSLLNLFENAVVSKNESVR